MGAEDTEAQPFRNGNEKSAEALLSWANGQGARGIYENTLLTCMLEYAVILLFGVSLIVEYYHNVYQQEYFGSFNPVFLVIVLMAGSGYGFARLVNMVGVGRRAKSGAQKKEDDY